MTPADDDPDANDASGGCFVELELISGCSHERCSKTLKNNNILFGVVSRVGIPASGKIP